MSRCFPYPPPGYKLSRASNDALIESIKLQREREKARAEKKKDRKREKKEKKKLKEEKAQKASSISCDVYGILQKAGKEENEQLERSGITEELELPVNSQNPSNSSDSTQNSNNSNKRKRHESPPNGGHTGGNIIRFRLPSQKQRIEKKIDSKVDEFRPTSGRTDSINKYETSGNSRAQLDELYPIPIPTAAASQLPSVGLNKDISIPTAAAAASQLRSVGLNKDISIPTPTPPPQVPSLGLNKETNQRSTQQIDDSREKHHDHVSKKSKKQHRAAKKYEHLIDCIPLLQPNELMDYDEDWLHKKNLQGPDVKVHRENLEESDGQVKTHNQMSCASSCLMWPRAEYLREADIFALPYTIPFLLLNQLQCQRDSLNLQEDSSGKKRLVNDHVQTPTFLAHDQMVVGRAFAALYCLG